MELAELVEENARVQVMRRFWSKVDVRGPDECWTWTGSKRSGGYGSFGTGRSHRVSWEFRNGEIEGGLWVLHHCDNPSCVNPKHLFLGNAQDNMDDCVQKGRTARGSKQWRSALTESKVADIRRDYKNGGTMRRLARVYGVSRHCIYQVVRRKRWLHVEGGQSERLSSEQMIGRDNFGEHNGRAKLSAAQVHEIRRLRSEGLVIRVIAEMFNISETTVADIVKRKKWKHLA